MKKALCSILCVLILMSSLSGCAEKSSPVDDFEYEMVNGEVVITGYSGTDLKIYIPSKINDRPVTRIGEKAFSEYDMTHVTIPDTVTQIDEYAFYECKCLTTVEWSDNLKTIGKSAFYGCESMKSIKLPATLERINQRAFQRCGLKQVGLPENLQFIGAYSFDRCENLSSLEIPDNTEIEIGLNTERAGQVGYLTFFDSPVGGSSVTTYYDSALNSSKGNEEYEQLDTAIVVNADSYAYQQVVPYAAGYGLTIEAVEGSAAKDQEDKNYLQDVQDAFGNLLDSLNPFEKKETLYLLTRCESKNDSGEVLSRTTYTYDDSGLVTSCAMDLPESESVFSKETLVYETIATPCDGKIDLQKEYTYDEHGSPTYVDDGRGTVYNFEYTYDTKGRVTTFTQSFNGQAPDTYDLKYGNDGTIKLWLKDSSRSDPVRTWETNGTSYEQISKIMYRPMGGNENFYFDYDDTGSLTEFHRVGKSGETSCRAFCTYDEEGRVTSEKGFRGEATYEYEAGRLVAINGEKLEYSQGDNGEMTVTYGNVELTYVPIELPEDQVAMARYRWNQFCGGYAVPHDYLNGLYGVRYPVFDLGTVLLLPSMVRG